MKDTISLKNTIFWFGLVTFFSLMSLLPDEQVPEDLWVPRSEISDSEKRRSNPARTQEVTVQNSYGWEEDKRNESNNWQDFLEDCDNLGIDPHDPDAQELWSEKY